MKHVDHHQFFSIFLVKKKSQLLKRWKFFPIIPLKKLLHGMHNFTFAQCISPSPFAISIRNIFKFLVFLIMMEEKDSIGTPRSWEFYYSFGQRASGEKGDNQRGTLLRLKLVNTRANTNIKRLITNTNTNIKRWKE